MTVPNSTPAQPQLLLTEFVIFSSSHSAAVGIPTDANTKNKFSTPLADFAETFKTHNLTLISYERQFANLIG